MKRKQTEAGAGDEVDGSSKLSEGSEWKRNVCWKETCVK